jgi:hypothetical protein
VGIYHVKEVSAMNDPKQQQGKQDHHNEHQKPGHNPNDPQHQKQDPKYQQEKGQHEEKKPQPTR